MTDQPRLALTFEDVLLVPRRSSIRSRRHVSTRSRFTRGVELTIPIVSANMDTVTTAPMAVAMAELGGLGVLHRFLPVDAQAEEVRRVKRYLGQVIEQPYTIAPERTVAEAAAEARRAGRDRPGGGRPRAPAGRHPHRPGHGARTPATPSPRP